MLCYRCPGAETDQAPTWLTILFCVRPRPQSVVGVGVSLKVVRPMVSILHSHCLIASWAINPCRHNSPCENPEGRRLDEIGSRMDPSSRRSTGERDRIQSGQRPRGWRASARPGSREKGNVHRAHHDPINFLHHTSKRFNSMYIYSASDLCLSLENQVPRIFPSHFHLNTKHL